MTFKNLAAVIDKAVAEGADQTVAKTGGGEQSIAAEGPVNLRLVAYIELGKKEKSYQGKPKIVEEVSLTFELSGRNHPPIETDNGPVPQRITITESLSLNEKARFFKLFQLLNYKGTAKHCAALLGAAYRGRIIHREYTGRDNKPHKIAELYDRKLGAYTITAPRVEVTDPETGEPTGEYREVKVAAAASPLRCFIWSHADKEQWDSLFIDGEYAERKNEAGEVTAPAKSKNQFQLRIRAALNYKGSPIQKLLANGGAELDLPDDGVVGDDDGADEGEALAHQAEKVSPTKPAVKSQAAHAAKSKAAKGDPLAGIDDDIPF
jgi:hypothetical protein